MPVIPWEPVSSVTVKTAQVLAVINGKPIQLHDLIPLGPDENEKAMTEEQFQSRLSRAIEIELISQTAQARGVGLTPEQQQRLNDIVKDHKDTFREYKQQGISWSSVTTAQLEFEKRLTSSLMLQQNLDTKEAGATPSSNPSVQAQYEQALSRILAGLKASANINL